MILISAARVGLRSSFTDTVKLIARKDPLRFSAENTANDKRDEQIFGPRCFREHSDCVVLFQWSVLPNFLNIFDGCV